MAVSDAVPLLVDGGIQQPEVRRQIHDGHSRLKQRNSQRNGGRVRNRKQCDLGDISNRGGRRLDEHHVSRAGKRRVHARDRLTRIGGRGRKRKSQARVPEDKANRLDARIARCSHHCHVVHDAHPLPLSRMWKQGYVHNASMSTCMRPSRMPIRAVSA